MKCINMHAGKIVIFIKNVKNYVHAAYLGKEWSIKKYWHPSLWGHKREGIDQKVSL